MCAPAAEERCWVAVFDSIHYVLAAEKVFKERGVWCDLVPTPRRISSDCGMALEFRQSDLARAREALGRSRAVPRGVYRPAAEGYEAVSLWRRRLENDDRQDTKSG